MLEEHTESLNRIIYRYNQAERLIKAYELRQFEVLAASINELRYAGRRAIDLLEAIANDKLTKETSRDALIDVEQACTRACHDAVDATVLAGLKRMADLKERYSRDELNRFSARAMDFDRNFIDARTRIQKSREDRTERTRIYDELYKELFGGGETGVFPVFEFFDELERNFWDVKDNDKNANVQQQIRLYAIMAGALAIGVAIGVLA